MSEKVWQPDPTATLIRRLGMAPWEPGSGGDNDLKGTQNVRSGCPDVWALSNGDVAIVGRDLTEVYRSRLPEDMSVREDERLIVLPGPMFIAAKADVSDA